MQGKMASFKDAIQGIKQFIMQKQIVLPYKIRMQNKKQDRLKTVESNSFNNCSIINLR